MVYPITAEQQLELDNIFTFHPPHGNQVQRYERIRQAAKALWEEVQSLTPGSAEQTLARRSLEMMVFWANASIARNEPPPREALAHEGRGPSQDEILRPGHINYSGKDH